MKGINYTELRLKLKKCLNLVVNNAVNLFVERKYQKDLVVISLDEYNSLKETQYLLSGKNREVLLKSAAEANKGK